MTREEFRALCASGIVVLDGATGSNLQKACMPGGVCPEQWIAENPQALLELQKNYIAAGSRIVYAPTFGANRIKLKEYGLQAQAASLNAQLVALSKRAAAESGRDDVYVAGDMTMTGQQLAPLGMLTLPELLDAYREQARALSEAGADLIVIETMMRLAETRAALIAVREVCELPVMVTMSFAENGKTLYGTDPETAVEVLQALGADAVGVNCGAGPDKLLAVLERMASHAAVPLIAKPNAGLPKLGADGSTVYDMAAEPFASHMKTLMESGAAIVGGCCGTDPDYIAQTAALAAQISPRPAAKKEARYLTTERACTLANDALSIGCIDPADDEDLAEEYREGVYDTLLDLLDEQADEEPDVICLAADGEGIDGKEIFPAIIEEAMQYTNLPLAFTSADPDTLAAALLAYPGRAGVVAGEMDKKTAEALCVKYGAVLL